MVIDSHIFLWYIQDSPQLPQFIKDKLSANPTKFVLPTICIWEILVLVEKKRIGFDVYDIEKHLRDSITHAGFQEASINHEIAFLSRSLPFEHDDPADRFIAATAKYLNMPLITMDGNLKKLPWLSTDGLSNLN